MERTASEAPPRVSLAFTAQEAGASGALCPQAEHGDECEKQSLLRLGGGHTECACYFLNGIVSKHNVGREGRLLMAARVTRNAVVRTSFSHDAKRSGFR
jgi:hypothetical protein